MKAVTIKSYVVLFLALISLNSCREEWPEDFFQNREIQKLKAAMAPYRNHENGLIAGWDTDLSGCVEHPELGGMGHHFARMEYFDAEVELLKPEVLLYAMNEQGKMELLGVEYIVPFDFLPETEKAPVLLGRAFKPNYEQQIWALHVWTHRDNPAGIFADFNPTVTCDYWIEAQVDMVREHVSTFGNFESATAAGWATDLSGCVAHPDLGGMGHHFARLEFMDGRVNPLEPQVMLFAPAENGEMDLLGVEYIVPFDILPETAEPPVLFNQPFHQNHEQQIWALHVWTHRENPAGVFADFNPTVNCE